VLWRQADVKKTRAQRVIRALHNGRKYLRAHRLRRTSSAIVDVRTARHARLSINRNDREHLTPDEVDRLIEAAKANRHGHRNALMVLLAYRRGLRAAEVVDLRWEQVDFKSAILSVR
jgi:integrase